MINISKTELKKRLTLICWAFIAISTAALAVGSYLTKGEYVKAIVLSVLILGINIHNITTNIKALLEK